MFGATELGGGVADLTVAAIFVGGTGWTGDTRAGAVFAGRATLAVAVAFTLRGGTTAGLGGGVALESGGAIAVGGAACVANSTCGVALLAIATIAVAVTTLGAWWAT